MKIKLNADDKMVEIPINQMTHYKNWIELGIMLRTHTLAKDEHDSELLAEEVVHRLFGMIEEILNKEGTPYGIEITNWEARVHDTEIAKEDE